MKKSFVTQSLMILLLFSQACCFIHSQEVGVQENLEKKVKRYIGWMTEKNKPDVWVAASRMERLGQEAVPLIKREIKNLPENAQVACAKVLISLKDSEYGMQILLQVAEKGQGYTARLDAIAIIGIYGSYEIEDKLNQILEASFDPHIKIALAKSLWQVSRLPHASEILRSFLSSDNNDIRYAAALALGEVGNVKAAQTVLAELKDEPSWRGRLAKTLLAQETQINRYEMLLHKKQQQNNKDNKDNKDNEAAKDAGKSRYPVIDEIIDKIKEYHVDGDQFNIKDLIDSGVRGIVSATDQHSAFWDEREWDDFTRTTLKEEYVGIGVYVNDKNGSFTVIAPIYSGPAYRAGIRSMDRILEVNDWPTTGKATDEIINRIRGEQGTMVKLKIYRDGWAKVREIEVRRESIQVPSLFTQMLPEKIGYMRLTQFGGKATENLETALGELEKQELRALILDLRGNAGGWLKAAVDIVDAFLPAGKLIVYSQGRHAIKGRKYEYFSTDDSTHNDFPLVLLVDQSSASASEIVAGTLQYYKRAVLVGAQTFGKGSVQEPLELNTRPGTRLKLTIAKYFLPDGRCIHNTTDKTGKIIQHNGVMPDVKIAYDNLEPWKNEEYAKIEEKGAFKKYIEDHYDKNKELFFRLADNDALSTKEYPQFDEWYNSLNTKGSQQDVREWLRGQLRRRVADDRGKEYACDYLEDLMLQRGIVELCNKLQLKTENIAEYQVFAKKFVEPKKDENKNEVPK